MIAHAEFEIDRDPFEMPLEEKIFLVAKRACFGFAGVALTLGALDLAGIHSVDGAYDFWQNSRRNILTLGDTVRTGVQNISIVPSSLSLASPETVAVRIPSSAARIAPKSQSLPQSPVAKLAAVGSQDAVQMAMAPPSASRVQHPEAQSAASSKIGTAVKAELVAMPKPAPLSAMASAPASVHPGLASPQPAAAIPGRLANVESDVLATPSLAERTLTVSTEAPIPLSAVPLPRAAPGIPPPSPAERLGLVGAGKEKSYNKALRCLANAIYFEARSEPVRGQMAVAQVVVNRAFSGFYPADICGVVYQNSERRLACQFTFACDGKRKVINERGNWARANRIAKQTLDGQIYLPEVGKSTHYHATYVHPNWAHEMRRLVRYGVHSFYRPYAWGNGADEPVWGTAAMAQASLKKTATK